MATKRRRGGGDQQDPRRVVIYRRVSALMGRVEDSDTFHSPALQLAAVRRHIAPMGMTEVAVVDDIDVSGRGFVRDGLDRVRAMVEAGSVDAFAVNDLSRVGRNTGESLRFITWLRDHGVTVISTVEKIDDTPEGSFVLTQWLALAQLYSDQMGRRWSDVIARRAHDQGAAHGRAPLGYRKVGGRMVVDDDLAPAVTEVFRRYAAGETVASIAAWFTNRRGTLTHRQRIKRMLGNEQYLGRVVLHGEAVDGGHPPLVDDELWQQVQARLDRDRTIPPRRLTPQYSLSGMVWCAHCGWRGNVWPSRRRADGEIVPRFTCRRKADGTQACDGFGVPRVVDIEEVVLARLAQAIHRLRGDTGRAAAQRRQADAAGSDAGKVEKRLAAVADAIPRLASRWAMQELGDDEYQTALAGLRAQERQLAAELSELRQAAGAPEPAVSRALIVELLALWPRMEPAERNRALSQVVARVTIRRGTSQTEPLAERIIVELR